MYRSHAYSLDSRKCIVFVSFWAVFPSQAFFFKNSIENLEFSIFGNWTKLIQSIPFARNEYTIGNVFRTMESEEKKKKLPKIQYINGILHTISIVFATRNRCGREWTHILFTKGGNFRFYLSTRQSHNLNAFENIQKRMRSLCLSYQK